MVMVSASPEGWWYSVLCYLLGVLRPIYGQKRGRKDLIQEKVSEQQTVYERLSLQKCNGRK